MKYRIISLIAISSIFISGLAVGAPFVGSFAEGLNTLKTKSVDPTYLERSEPLVCFGIAKKHATLCYISGGCISTSLFNAEGNKNQQRSRVVKMIVLAKGAWKIGQYYTGAFQHSGPGGQGNLYVIDQSLPFHSLFCTWKNVHTN